jgi:TRAP-type mannitol/chloroaromatic compound transport system substrate-binding protein
LVSALEVLDAVAGGAAQLGHTAAFFWQGKEPAAAFFTAIPFGMIADEHAAWIYHGGGQALWDELYAPLGVKPFMAGNTGMGMAGWFKRPLRSLDDVKGLRYRIPGLGGEVLRRMGGVPVALAPGEIFTALQAGTIDGAEFLGPWSDLAFGFYKAASYYCWPGFHEPNGTGECLVARELWEELPEELREVIVSACAAENAYSLAETEWYNGEALQTLVREHGVQVRQLPSDFLLAAREVSAEVLAEFSQGSEIERRIYASYAEGRQRAIAWSKVSIQALLEARA